VEQPEKGRASNEALPFSASAFITNGTPSIALYCSSVVIERLLFGVALREPVEDMIHR